MLFLGRLLQGLFGGLPQEEEDEDEEQQQHSSSASRTALTQQDLDWNFGMRFPLSSSQLSIFSAEYNTITPLKLEYAMLGV